jgi:hypothetical protein
MEKVKEYAFSTILDTPYEDAISGVTGALKEEGEIIQSEKLKKIAEEVSAKLQEERAKATEEGA